MLSCLADSSGGKNFYDDSIMNHDLKHTPQILMEIFNCLHQLQSDDSYLYPADLTGDSKSYNCDPCTQINSEETRRKPPPPYPFHKYAPKNQTAFIDDNFSSPNSSNLSNLLLDNEFTMIQTYFMESDSEPLPPPYPNQGGMSPSGWSDIDWSTPQPPPYEAPKTLRSGLQQSTVIESSTQSFGLEPTTNQLDYSQPQLERGTALNDNDEDLRALPGETVKDTILRCFSGKKKTNNSTNGGSPVLWQFIIDLLADPGSSDIIYWHGDDGTFVMADRNKVAYMWGKVKRPKKSNSKTTMSYEKLSRSLRYYYSKGFLRKVSGERYAYQFFLPGLFKLVRLTPRIPDSQFIQEDFEITRENINSLNIVSFDRIWSGS